MSSTIATPNTRPLRFDDLPRRGLQRCLDSNRGWVSQRMDDLSLIEKSLARRQVPISEMSGTYLLLEALEQVGPPVPHVSKLQGHHLHPETPVLLLDGLGGLLSERSRPFFVSKFAGD